MAQSRRDRVDGRSHSRWELVLTDFPSVDGRRQISQNRGKLPFCVGVRSQFVVVCFSLSSVILVCLIECYLCVLFYKMIRIFNRLHSNENFCHFIALDSPCKTVDYCQIISILLCFTCKTRSSAIPEKQRVSCPNGGGLGPPAHFPAAPSGYTYAYGRIRNPQQTYVKRAVQ